MSDVLSREKERTNVKVVIVGDSGVGKSNLISRYMQDKFLVGNNTTIGLEFNQKDVSF